MSRSRADTLLAERGLVPSRAAAAASVRAGRVRLGEDGPLVAKPSQMLPDDAEIVIAEPQPFVSRGGVKLANALDAMPVVVKGRRCLDAGASTGGFTDCLLQRGASEVIAVDVGHGQLDWKLRNDERVHVMERVNVRELPLDQLPFAPELITADLSFISVLKVLPVLVAAGAGNAELLIMVKPQFELGPERVGKGGVVREASDRRDALVSVAAGLSEAGMVVRGLASSGLPGPKGNLETFIWATSTGDPVDLDAAITDVEPLAGDNGGGDDQPIARDQPLAEGQPTAGATSAVEAGR